MSDETSLTDKQKKKLERQKEDKRDRENDIKYGIRYKLITVVTLIVLVVVITITWISSNNQSKSLLQEKKKQGAIIVRGLASAIKTRLLDIYAANDKLIKRINTANEYKNFYLSNGISELIFEDIDSVTSQPDVLYAYIIGKSKVVLGHSDPDIVPYSIYEFPALIESYFDAYKASGMKKPEPILTKINFKKKIRGEKKEAQKIEVIEAIDFSYILAFKNDAEIDDAIAEVHIGISLESVNRQIFDNKVQMQAIGFFSIIIGMLLAVFVATVIARPIRKMIDGMRKVSQGDFSASVLVSSSDEVGLLSRTFNVMLKGMSILVSPEVAQVVLSGGDLLTSGQRRNVTVLFSDIRGFTTISESLTPHEVVEMLNDYLEIMTDIIIKFGGVVDKFVGDEIFAVFGAPFDHPMHPLCAAATALDMGTELDKHNVLRKSEGKLPINIGIGLNTGDVISGAMGSTKRIDFTSIGDAVNLGARLEGTNKIYSTLAIISEFTYEKIQEDVVVRELDMIRVKGKLEPVLIYELIALTKTGESKLIRYLENKKLKKI
ncbi:MAG: HAMP domain-containing protein [Spirochaetia bacterium]|nr:HAMP domain-containing protein [Spirochaetia bacterium]